MSESQLSKVSSNGHPDLSGAAGTGGHGICLGGHGPAGTALGLQGAGLVAREGSPPESDGTGSDSARPSQSPVLSEAGSEDHAMQGVDRTEAREEGLPKKRGKRKLPLPDLDAIKDVDERRRQRRLIKNRNTAAASRVRKQLELEELSRRMRSLEQDNANLRCHVESRNAEIARLRAVVNGLHSSDGNPPPQALSPSKDLLPLGPSKSDQQTMERGYQQTPTVEALRLLAAQPQNLAADPSAMSLAQSDNAAHRLGGPAGIRGGPHTLSAQEYGQQQHCSHQPIHLEPALPDDEFAEALGGPRRPGRAGPAGQGRAVLVASSATSTLSASERAALAPAASRHPSLLPAGPLRMTPHRRGSGAGDNDTQLPHNSLGSRKAGSHADFLAFPWPEVMDMVGQQERQPPVAFE